jgi:hypothetical protein
MVRFGWPVKSTKYSEKDAYSPPPYREEDHASPEAFPSTTSPAMPTIPTHFFTLPVWRKYQGQQPDPPKRLSMSDVGNCQQSSDCHRRTQETLDPREKALPPIPIVSNEDASGAHLRRVDSPIEGQSLSNRPSRQAPQSVVAPATRPSPSRATAALAHASLAIGLPHSMPRASASSSRSDVNSMAFIPIPRSDQHPFPPSSVRRTKSFHQHEYSRDDGGSPASTKRFRRARGISFDPVNDPNFEGKGKGKALEDIPSHVTPPRKLVHRASFWGRKRNDSSKSAVSTLPPRNHFDHLSHILPALPPVSPLHFDSAVSRSSRSSQTEEQLPPSPPGLSPHDEYRNRPLPPSLTVSSSEMPVRSLQPPACRRQRPSTADSAIDRSRALSLYGSSPTTDKSALRSPLVPAPSRHLDAAVPRRVARPRSQTNPPLLHRISANLFSFGSSASSLSVSKVPGVQVDSPEPSPRASTSRTLSLKPQLDEESPVNYVDRLLGTVSKAEIASLLASRYDSPISLLDSET